MILSMVDLPEPFVPTKPKTSPRFTVNEMSFKARNSLNMSLPFTSARKYSLRLFRRSLAILKTMLTWSTTTTDSGVAAVLSGVSVADIGALRD